MAVNNVHFFSRALRRPVTVNVCIPTDTLLWHGPARNGNAAITPIPVRKPLRVVVMLDGIRGSAEYVLSLTDVEALSQKYNVCVVVVSGENHFYADSDITGDHYGEFVCYDVPEFVRESFRVSDRREDMYIAGYSMGGLGAVTNGLRHPEIFSRIMMFSSGLLKDMFLASTADPEKPSLRTSTELCAHFGLRDISEYENSIHDYEYLAGKLVDEGKQKPQIFMSVGKEEQMRPCNEKYCELLRKLGYDVTFELTEYQHNYYGFGAAMDKAFAWLPAETEFTESRRAFSKNPYNCFLPLYAARYTS